MGRGEGSVCELKCLYSIRKVYWFFFLKVEIFLFVSAYLWSFCFLYFFFKESCCCLHYFVKKPLAVAWIIRYILLGSHLMVHQWQYLYILYFSHYIFYFICGVLQFLASSCFNIALQPREVQFVHVFLRIQIKTVLFYFDL